MGFFDSLSKIASEAKKVADVISEHSSNQSKPQQKAATPSVNTQSAVRDITIEKSTTANSRYCENEMFACYDDKPDEIYIQKTLVNNAFHQFDVGAGEIEWSYMYSPNISDVDGWADYESGEPVLYFGYCQEDYLVVEKYEATGEVKPNYLLFRVVGNDIIKYKTITTYQKWGAKRICYHYKKPDRDDLYYQIVLEYSTKYVGTDIEKKCFEAFNEFVSNLTVTLK